MLEPLRVMQALDDLWNSAYAFLMSKAMDSAEDFLNESHKFRLGALPTEQSHPLTKNLSDWAKHDLPRAIQTLCKVDRMALQELLNRRLQLCELQSVMSQVLSNGGRLFFVGCGATGRLSLSIEFFWRERFGQTPLKDRVISLMAGGDVALVHALEGFEDHADYGARHLESLGFSSRDILIASTEGGETPFVIGAAQRATEISQYPTVFAYCNPTAILKSKIERSRHILENPKILAVELFVGSMAITGSTRMQASTALMLALSSALFAAADEKSTTESAVRLIEELVEHLNQHADFRFLAPLIEAESEVYKNEGQMIYATDRFGLTVFTDTTERSPTFSLPAFDNFKFPKMPHASCHVELLGTQTEKDGWSHLLGRNPRSLNWPEVHKRTSEEYLLGFDFSEGSSDKRQALTGQVPQRFAIVDGGAQGIQFRFRNQTAYLHGFSHGPDWRHHVLLKMALNIQSTLVMGRLGRYEGNFMTWVYPTNGKLVDRAARYTLLLLERRGVHGVSYEEVVRAQFAEKATLKPNESIVLKTADRLAKLKAH